MKNFIDHLSCFNLNESQYWVVPDVYRRCDFEVSWFRTATGEPVWKVRTREKNTEWQEFTNREAVEKLSESGIDLLELRNCIADTVLRQAVYVAQISKSAKELLGDQTIDTAVAENEVFVNELVAKIKDALNNTEDKANTVDSAVDSTTVSKPSRVKHLKLISQPAPQ